MKQSTSLNSGFSIIIGAFLLIEGIWGLSDEVVFGILTTNQTHATIHIILGLLGVFLGIRQKAVEYCALLGTLLLSVGAMYFINGTDVIVEQLLNVNENVAYLNIFIGVAAIASTFRRTEMIVNQIPAADDEILAHNKPIPRIIKKIPASKKEIDTTRAILKTVHSVKKETPSADKEADITPIPLKTVHRKKQKASTENKAKTIVRKAVKKT